MQAVTYHRGLLAAGLPAFAIDHIDGSPAIRRRRRAQARAARDVRVGRWGMRQTRWYKLYFG